jgi:hypothetical protein
MEPGGGAPGEVLYDEQAITQNAEIRIANHPALPAPDGPPDFDYGRLTFLTDGGASDGQTYVPEKPLGLWVVDGNNEWAQVASKLRIFNVLDYGAYGKTGEQGFPPVNDQPAIQRALDAAASTLGGGVVYFPRGRYHICESIVVPRKPGISIILQGQGMNATRVGDQVGIDGQGYCTLADGDPVIDFSADEQQVAGFQINDMSVSREGLNRGPVIRHTSSGDSQRFIHSGLRNVYVQMASDDTYTATEDAIHIEGGLHCFMDNVRIDGGFWALSLEDSSHCTLRNVRQERYSNNGFRILSGGSHQLDWLRTENIIGTALKLEAKPGFPMGSITIRGLWTEGKKTTRVLELAGHDSSAVVTDIAAFEVGVASPCYTSIGTCGGVNGGLVPRYGITMNHARDVHIRGGTLASWEYALGKAISIGEARNVIIEGMHARSAATELSFYDISGSAENVRLEIYDRDFNQFELRSPTTKLQTACAAPCPWAFVQTNEILAAGTPGPGGANIFTLKMSGYNQGAGTPWFDVPAGRVITVLGQVTSGTAYSIYDKDIAGAGNIQLDGNTTWTGTAGQVLRLLFDGSEWRELQRL